MSRRLRLATVVTLGLLAAAGLLGLALSLSPAPSGGRGTAEAGEEIRPSVLMLENGQRHAIVVGRFASPYVVHYRGPGAGFDTTRPTEVIDGLWSTASGRRRDRSLA